MPAADNTRRGGRSGAGPALLLAFGACACGASGATEDPRPWDEPDYSRVQLSRVVPEGCTELGEVSGSGEATDDPTQAAELARTEIRRRAVVLGANYVLLEMQTGGPTRMEGTTVGAQVGLGAWASHSWVTSDLESALWGRAFFCPSLAEQQARPPAPSANTPCTTHADCPSQQFCSPAGRCRRPN